MWLVISLFALLGLIDVGLGVAYWHERKDKLESIAIAKEAKDIAANEYDRAVKEGSRVVHAMAVEATWNIWNGDRALAKQHALSALQMIEKAFAPPPTPEPSSAKQLESK